MLAITIFSSCGNRTSTNEVTGQGAAPADTVNWKEIKVTDHVKSRDLEKFPEELIEFYKNRDNDFAWFRNGKLNRDAFALMQELRDTALHPGLRAGSYRLFAENPGLEHDDPERDFADDDPERAAYFDVLLSDAFMKYANDLSTGKVDEKSLDVVWQPYPGKIEPAAYLEDAVSGGSVKNALRRLRPHHLSYYELTDAYNTMTESEWPLPGYFKTVKKGTKSKDVVSLKRYLHATGDLAESDSSYLSSTLFDDTLEEAVKRFQVRHGLEDDGIPGTGTLDKMNVPLSFRLNQLLVNIDRIRSLPAYLGNRFIIVNIPGFYMEYYENEEIMTEMNVVVGELENYTPVLRDTMTYIVLNPQWNVPESIVMKEIIPAVQKDIKFLERNEYIVLKSSYNSSDTIDPEDIKWNRIKEDEKPEFRIVQLPGNKNSLGRIKFMFPNNHNIYLHDTPAGHLFKIDRRDFSHGCIRLERPVDLAGLLLEGQMDPVEIREILESGETTDVPLDKKVPVHFMYNTAWIDKDGLIHFRDDIYHIDEQAVSLLKK